MRLIEFTSPMLIRLPLRARDKLGAITELVDLIAEAGKTTDRNLLLRSVQEREAARSTGIGRGLAVPHAKCDAVSDLVVAIGRAEPPIEFAAIDGQPVRLIALLASPSKATSLHIQALARLSRLAMQPAVWDMVLSAASPPDLLRLIGENDGGV